MQYALALLALVASVSAQTATGTPPSCSTDFPQTFEIAPVNVSSSHASKRDLIAERAALCNIPPFITLKGGVLTDQNQRTAEIVANHQFQFDNPLQAGRHYDAGFSVCENDTLAIGGSAIFWACNSGNFSNIYDESLGKQCYESYIQVIPCGVVVSGSSSLAVSAATSAPTSASSTPSTSATTGATSVPATTAATTSSLPGPAVASVAPYPARNSTTAAGTASPTTPGHATSSALTAPASGASAITVGSTFGLVAAALVAFAMF